ncbi:hypothetical protein [Rhodanobacter lindaniclasticus]
MSAHPAAHVVAGSTSGPPTAASEPATTKVGTAGSGAPTGSAAR